MYRFLTVCSARFAAPVKLAPFAAQDGVVFHFGSDADYPEHGMPQRRKTEFHWIGAWRDESDVDSFMAAPATWLPQLKGAEAVNGFKLLPYHQRGAEVVPVEVDPVRPKADEPVAIVTSIGAYLTESEAIAAGKEVHVLRQTLAHADGLLQEFLLFPFMPGADLFTVTTWRDEAAARDWAYRGDAHRSATAFYKASPETPRVSFTRCRIASRCFAWK